MKNFKHYIVVIFSLLFLSVVFLSVVFLGFDNSGEKAVNLEDQVLPLEGVVLPIMWGDLGDKMIEIGVIDSEKFESIYESRGGLSSYEKKLLYGKDNKEIVLDKDNAHVVLNLLWAFGLVNKNEILDSGPMVDEGYDGNPGNFASTGGWTLGKEDSMKYYSTYPLVVLNDEQQKMVEEVSKNIYRPCCQNSTYFPDCNHGMAMLGLIELLVSNDVSEEDIYDLALRVNSYWFPETYLNLAHYFNSEGVEWNLVNAKDVLGVDYSSVIGYGKILEKMQPLDYGGGGSCGV